MCINKENLFCRVLREAKRSGTAVAAINILNDITARAAVEAATRASRPIILQPSVATVKKYGVKQMAGIVNNIRSEASVPVVLHLDHCRDEELAKECIKAGWDSVMMDYSAKPFDMNVQLTSYMVGFAHKYGVAVEGEIGVIQGVEDDISHSVSSPASLEDTLEFVRMTGVDAVAPAIGTAHGLYKGRPELNFDLVEKLGVEHIPVVVHGGTGLSKENFQQLIRCGAAKINISTALKCTYLDSAREALKKEDISPNEFDRLVQDACSAMIEAFVRLFANEEVDVYAG